jgi:class 3 adenylate cyclase
MTDIENLPVQSSVVILRIRDYARRAVAEQARLSAQLDTVLAMLLPYVPARSRLVLTGNGVAAVAVLEDAPAALSFAERALHAYDAGLGLCIGIDHGPVEVVNNETSEELAGDGVATASVLAASASDTGLLVTENFRTALAFMSPGAESALVPAASLSDTGLRTYKAYTLDREATLRRHRRFMLVAVVLAGAMLAIAMSLRLWLPDRPRPLAAEFAKLVPSIIIDPTR